MKRRSTVLQGAAALRAPLVNQQSSRPGEGFDCLELRDLSVPSTGSVGKAWLSNMWANGITDPLAATWRSWNWGATP